MHSKECGPVRVTVTIEGVAAHVIEALEQITHRGGCEISAQVALPTIEANHRRWFDTEALPIIRGGDVRQASDKLGDLIRYDRLEAQTEQEARVIPRLRDLTKTL